MVRSMTPTSTQSEPLISRLRRKRREIIFASILTLAAAVYMFVAPTVSPQKDVRAAVSDQIQKPVVARP